MGKDIEDISGDNSKILSVYLQKKANENGQSRTEG